MKPVRTLINAKQIEELASRSNFRYGKTLVKDEAFKITKENAYNIHALVKHSSKLEYLTEFSSTSKGFRWKCSCNAKKDYFCEHCAGLGILLTSEKIEE